MCLRGKTECRRLMHAVLCAVFTRNGATRAATIRLAYTRERVNVVDLLTGRTLLRFGRSSRFARAVTGNAGSTRCPVLPKADPEFNRNRHARIDMVLIAILNTSGLGSGDKRKRLFLRNHSVNSVTDLAGMAAIAAAERKRQLRRR